MEDTTAAKEILQRLRQGTGATSDTKLGHIVGVSQQAIYNARTNNKLPDSWVKRAAEQFNLSTDWLYFGEGSMYRGENALDKGNDNAAQVTSASMSAQICSRCRELEKELTWEREGNRRKDELLVEWLKKVEDKIEESGQLRVENVKLQTFLDTARQMCRDFENENKELQAENAELKQRLSPPADASGESVPAKTA